jgi:DNA invertase Pin-like site-specific DNA recombinase
VKTEHRAKANDVKIGRKPKVTPHQEREATERVVTGNETLREIARRYNVHNSTIFRLIGSWEGRSINETH